MKSTPRRYPGRLLEGGETQKFKVNEDQEKDGLHQVQRTSWGSQLECWGLMTGCDYGQYGDPGPPEGPRDHLVITGLLKRLFGKSRVGGGRERLCPIQVSRV